jgi:hypothetical protein
MPNGIFARTVRSGNANYFYWLHCFILTDFNPIIKLI